MCCGESLAEREAGETEGKVLGQIAAGLAGLKAEQVAGMVIAYEPIWAIGTGRTATADDAQAVCRAIRDAVAPSSAPMPRPACGSSTAGRSRRARRAELMAQPDIDGALVGGASLDPDEFARIVQFAAR